MGRLEDAPHDELDDDLAAGCLRATFAVAAVVVIVLAALIGFAELIVAVWP